MRRTTSARRAGAERLIFRGGDRPSTVGEALRRYQEQFRDFELTGFISSCAMPDKDTSIPVSVWHLRLRELGDDWQFETVELFSKGKPKDNGNYRVIRKIHATM